MTAPLLFLDLETTGLSLHDDIWEFAAIKRLPDGREQDLHIFLAHDRDKCSRLPEPFRSDHVLRGHAESVYQPQAVEAIQRFIGDDSPHVVGACPNFDTERLALLLDRHGQTPAWHYHLIDVENLAVGWLMGRYAREMSDGLPPVIDLPWDSDELSRAVDVDPAQFERHTAMGDVMWARALYDRVMT